MVQVRRTHPVFRRRYFFQGRPLHGGDVKDVVWLEPDGSEMTTEEWNQDFARCLGVAHDLVELMQRFRLLVDEQLRITDDVDEKNVRDLEAQFRFLLVSH